MSNELRDKGIEIANQAVQADNAGQYEDAINKYCKAAEYLLTALKYEKNPVTLKTIREKCVEYTSRAETLKKGMDNPKGKSAKGGGGGDAEQKEDTDDEEEALIREVLDRRSRLRARILSVPDEDDDEDANDGESARGAACTRCCSLRIACDACARLTGQKSTLPRRLFLACTGTLAFAGGSALVLSGGGYSSNSTPMEAGLRVVAIARGNVAACGLGVKVLGPLLL